MAAKTYSPKEISVSVNGVLVSGYADGTFVKVGRSTDTFTKKVGAGGEVTRVHSSDKSGMVTLTLHYTSDTNRYLSLLAKKDEQTLDGVVTITIKDALGNSIYVANNAWIKKISDVDFADDLSNLEWAFDCEELTAFHNGSPGFGLPSLGI